MDTLNPSAARRDEIDRPDLWVGLTALAAALFALPLAPSSWHGPEVAATLAIAATAMLAGQRWAIAVVVVAELLLLPTVWPRAFLADGESVARIAAMGSVIAIVPGVFAMRRGARAIVHLTGWQRSRRNTRRLQVALAMLGLFVGLLPIL